MNTLVNFLAAHKEALSLFALAAVVTMREELPSPLNRVALLVWGYAWLHDALKTFVSFRAPAGKSTAPTNEAHE
jgi:hypothetical protein